MNIFFEKLTGAHGKPAPSAAKDIPLEKKQYVSAAIPLPKEAPPIMEQTKSEEKNILPEIAEEEGELTVDVYDHRDTFVIQSTVAGVAPENLDVVVAADRVTIRGTRTREEKIDDKNFHCKELFWGSFSRSVILPDEINDELAEATMKHGLLTIRLPKKKRGATQKLKVRMT